MTIPDLENNISEKYLKLGEKKSEKIKKISAKSLRVGRILKKIAYFTNSINK